MSTGSWSVYLCLRCGGLVLAYANKSEDRVLSTFPSLSHVDESVPAKAREFIKQAVDSVHAPAGAIMLCASAVDAMLKSKKYTSGSLYSRIDKAADDHLITEEMAKWAHEVRLDANDQRHADESAELPDGDDAKRSIEFTQALADFLFVLPARVKRGLKNAIGAEGS